MVRKCISLLLILFTLMTRAVFAERLVLPGQLTEISEESFAGDSSITEVVIPEGTLEIGDNAFSGCSNLGRMSVPGSVVSLGEGFIDGSANDLLIRTVPDSAACRYAQNNLVDYQADTVYRALLIGQTYPDIPALKLNGPDNDVAAMNQCLHGFNDTPYQTTVCTNLTSDEILDTIADNFGSADSEDVSLLYFSGHGVSSDDVTKQGALLGVDNQSITANRLRSALDRIPGRKIVIIDACYSGNMIADRAQSDSYLSEKMITEKNRLSRISGSVETVSEETVQSSESFADSFISAFSKKKRSGLAGDSYFVLTAAEDEESFENKIGNHIMGLFTSVLVTGCGYDAANNCSTSLMSDCNDNGVLTLQEIYQYAWKKLIAEGQHVRVYPEDCKWFGVLR